MKQKLKLSSLPMHEWSFEAIGTHWWVGIYQEVINLESLQTQIATRIEQFDRMYSRFRADSLVTAMSKESGEFELPADGPILLNFYRQLYDATGGSVTPLVGQLLVDAGYDAEYSLEPKTLQRVPAWDDALMINGLTITTNLPVTLDFGAAGKGYLVDIISRLLQQHGIDRFCVDAGGDMVCRGLLSGLRVGLENPNNSDEAIGVVSLTDGAICGSSGSKRAWAGMAHIMDPHALKSPDHITAVWVTASTVMLADGIATALYFVEPDALRHLGAFEYLIMYNNSSVSHSADFPAELFTRETDHV